MSIFSGPTEHAANPPSTWKAERWGRGWAVMTAEGKPLDHMHGTKRSALAAIAEGSMRKLYEQEGRWYAGERIPGWRPWAELQAEAARHEAARLERERKRAAEEAARLERERPLRDALEPVREALGMLSGELEDTRQGLEAFTVGQVLTSDDVEALAAWAADDAGALSGAERALDEVDAGEVIDAARAPLLEAVGHLAERIRWGSFDAPRDLADAARMLEDIARDFS